MALISLFLTSLALVSFALPTVNTAQLTPENFASSVTNGLWFIEHYSPYCGHCTAFAPTWEKLVKEAETEFPNVNLAQVNCVLHGDLCNDNGVRAYPTMLMFQDGKIVEPYPARNSRDLDDLKQFLKQHVKRVAAEREEVAPVVETPKTPSQPLNPTGEVVALTSKTFQAALDQGPTFVKFFAPWCGHCKKLAPVWKQLARMLQGRVQIAEVNCEEEGTLCKENKIEGYPTLVYYSHGSKSEYNGGRKIDQLKSFAEKAASDSVMLISSVEELEKHVRTEKVVYVLVHGPGDSEIVDIVRKDGAVLLGSPVIYATSSSAIREKYGIPESTPWAIVALKDHDPQTRVAVFEGNVDVTHEALKSWLVSHRLPGSQELTQDSFQTVMNAPHEPLVIIAASTKRLQSQVEEKIRDFSKKWRVRTGGSGEVHGKEIVFTWMDAGRWHDWMKSMYGIVVDEDEDDLDDLPVVIADHKSLIYYNEDKSGSSLKLTSSGPLFSALEDAAARTLAYKHSENFVERVARYLNNKMISLEKYITEYPFRFAFFLISVLVVVFYLLTRWIGSEDRVEYVRVKAERID